MDATPFVPIEVLAGGASAAPPITGRPIAGVVNHHVLAADLMRGFFASLRAARPDISRFVVVSPDHHRRGGTVVSATQRSYAYRGMVIPTDAKAVRSLVDAGVVSLDEVGMFEHEHGIGALVPFLQRAFPEAAIVPLVVRSDAQDGDVRTLGRALASLDDGQTFFLVSADMSHYLPVDAARRNDRSTERWLADLDDEALMRANDDFTDNGRGLAVLAAFMEKLGVRPRFIKLGHAISSDYDGSTEFTTSYIKGMWVER